MAQTWGYGRQIGSAIAGAFIPILTFHSHDLLKSTPLVDISMMISLCTTPRGCAFANLLDKKSKELNAHEASRPAVVVKPENDPARESKIAETSTAIEVANARLSTEETNIRNATRRQAALVQSILTADRVIARLENLNRQIQAFINESKADFGSLGLSVDSILSVRWDKVQLTWSKEICHFCEAILSLWPETKAVWAFVRA